MQASSNRNKLLFYSTFFLLAGLHLAIVLLNHYYHRTFAYYYGVYNWAFYDYAHLQSSACPVLFDGTNSTFLQDHFSLLLIVLSPIYWISKFVFGTYTLLIIQWLSIAIGGWYTYRLIFEKWKAAFPALVAMICFFGYYAKFSAYMADCNLAIIGSSLIPAFFYFYELQQKRNLFFVFALLLIIREDFSLWLFFIAAFFLIKDWKLAEQRKLAFILMTTSLLFFILLFALVIPALETETKQFALFNYGALGDGPGKAFLFMLQHPFRSIELLFINHIDAPEWDGVKVKFYLMFGLSGGVLLFLRPAYLICLVPLIAKKMYNDDPIRWGYESYYGIEVASILPILIFCAMNELKFLKSSGWVTIILLLTLGGTVYGFIDHKNYHVFNKIRFYEPDFYRVDYPSDMERVFSEIPETAAVSASARLLPHLAYRNKIYYYPIIRDAEYVCLTMYADTWPASKEEYDAKIAELRTQGWKDFLVDGNVLILKKPSESLTGSNVNRP